MTDLCGEASAVDRKVPLPAMRTVRFVFEINA